MISPRTDEESGPPRGRNAPHSRPQHGAGPTGEAGQHPMPGGRGSDSGVPWPGTTPSHVRASGEPAQPAPWRGCLLRGQRHHSGGLFPGCDTERSLFPRRAGHSQHCLPGGVGCPAQACDPSCSPQLAEVSHPSCPGHAGKASWPCRGPPGGGNLVLPTLVRKATEGSMPPGMARGPEGGLVITFGPEVAQLGGPDKPWLLVLGSLASLAASPLPFLLLG